MDEGNTFVNVNSEDADNHRRIPATQYSLTWDQSEETCYYMGNSQGGPEYSHNPRESVIEGVQANYKTDALFATSFNYDMFDDSIC